MINCYFDCVLPGFPLIRPYQIILVSDSGQTLVCVVLGSARFARTRRRPYRSIRCSRHTGQLPARRVAVKQITRVYSGVVSALFPSAGSCDSRTSHDNILLQCISTCPCTHTGIRASYPFAAKQQLLDLDMSTLGFFSFLMSECKETFPTNSVGLGSWLLPPVPHKSRKFSSA